MKAINAAIGKARGDRDKARAEITRRFPSYADLVDPKPPTVDSVRETLREDEALLSFYFGRERSFVWAVPKRGAGGVRVDRADRRRPRDQGAQAARGAQSQRSHDR